MEEKKLRPLIPIQAKWPIAQLQQNIASAIDGTGPALSTTQLSSHEIHDEIALVVKTSGSSGIDKNVAISKSALISSATASHKYLGASFGDTWSLLLPINHIAGLNVIVRATLLGTQVIDNRNSEFYEDSDFISIVPTQLYKALNGDNKLLEHLSAAEAVLVGGAPLQSELRVNAESKGIKVVSTYGMTEMSGGCVYNNKPISGVKIEISDTGLIKLSGPMMATGYLDSSGNINSTNFKEWFETSDLGKLNSGLLTVTGRVDDVIISGGEKIAINLVEEEIEKIYPGLEFIIFSCPDNHWGEILSIGSTTKISLDLIKDKLGPIRTPKRVFRFEKIPRTRLGKPDRHMAAKFALDLGDDFE
jgi:O-succinylbenzoic acid--CoA ligase